MTLSSEGIIPNSGAATLEGSASLVSQYNAVAAAMFYEYRLNALGNEFAARSLSPVIVKGQAIVDLAFPKDEIRLSGDVDLLVGEDGEAVVRALADMGYQEGRPHSRHFKFGERGFSQHDERLPGYVEVHRCLDKILLRPIPYADILVRAKPSGRQGFRYPSIEDLILLVVLHASADIFFEPERVQRDLHFFSNLANRTWRSSGRELGNGNCRARCVACWMGDIRRKRRPPAIGRHPGLQPTSLGSCSGTTAR